KLGVSRRQLLICGDDLVTELVWKARIADGLTDLQTDPAQGLHIVEVDGVQLLPDKRPQLALFDELPISVCGDYEAAWDPDAETGEVPDHFPERGAFAANKGEVGEADVFEWKNNSFI